MVLGPSLAMCPKGGVLNSLALVGIGAVAGIVRKEANSLGFGCMLDCGLLSDLLQLQGLRCKDWSGADCAQIL